MILILEEGREREKEKERERERAHSKTLLPSQHEFPKRAHLQSFAY
jgi:hypothetical protein